MSVVTTVVFVTDHHRDHQRFAQLVRDGYTRYGTPYEQLRVNEQGGPKYGPGDVYHWGFNYMDGALRDALMTEPWESPGTVLWIYGESDDEPVIVRRALVYTCRSKVSCGLNEGSITSTPCGHAACVGSRH